MMARDLYIVGASGQIGQGVAAKFGFYVPLTSVRLGHMGKLAEFPYSKTSEKSTLLVVAGPTTRDEVRGISIDAYVSDLKALAMRYDHVVVASSVQVYNRRCTTPCVETDPVAPKDEYCDLQLRKEDVARKHHSGCVLRLSNVYGGHFRRKGVINELIAKARAGRELFVRDGHVIRDFIHIDDVVSALLTVIEQKTVGLYNLSTGVGTQVIEVYKSIGCHYGCAVHGEEIINTDVNDCLLASSTKLAASTGWAPTIDLHSGLQRQMEEKDGG